MAIAKYLLSGHIACPYSDGENTEIIEFNKNAEPVPYPVNVDYDNPIIEGRDREALVNKVVMDAFLNIQRAIDDHNKYCAKIVPKLQEKWARKALEQAKAEVEQALEQAKAEVEQVQAGETPAPQPASPPAAQPASLPVPEVKPEVKPEILIPTVLPPVK